MPITRATFTPRAFENWDFSLGVRSRAKAQAFQYAKHVVSAVNFAWESAHFKRAINWLEGGIHRELNAPVLSLPIVVVDDQASILHAVANSLRAFGFHNLFTYTNPDEAIRQAATAPPALLITDLDMPGDLQGHGLIEKIANLRGLARPAFILHSGNQATRSPIGRVAGIIQEHNVISVMKGDRELPQLIFQIALARVRGLPFALPEAPKVEEPAQYGALRETPTFKITSEIVHRLNNLLAPLAPNLTYYQERPDDLSVLDDIRSSVVDTLAFVEALDGFLRVDLNTVEDITETALYRNLVGHELDTLRNNFPLLPRHSRNNVKIPLEELFAKGLVDVRGVLIRMQQTLVQTPSSLEKADIASFNQAQRQLARIVSAANLARTYENREQVTAFAIAYGLVNSTSSGSSSPSS